MERLLIPKINPKKNNLGPTRDKEQAKKKAEISDDPDPELASRCGMLAALKNKELQRPSSIVS